MRLVVFGLSISSSWGNGHATLWRGLAKALGARGGRVVFFERDQPFYSDNRDLTDVPGCDLVLYRDFADIEARAKRELRSADAGMVTSFCPDGIAATALVTEHAARATFYDLDTPVTLAALARGETLPFIGPRGLRDFDLVLSFTGGPALRALEHDLGARRTAPLYGHVDPDQHRPSEPFSRFAGDLSYLGTYAADRQAALQALFIAPANRRPDLRFMLAGAQYPQDFPWTPNIFFTRHLPPAEHAAFFCSSRLTLNVTREAMRNAGFCPSGRLFEAAACGVPILTDTWPGLADVFIPGTEVLTAQTTEETLAALDRAPGELGAIAAAARARVLAAHTSAHRADELLALLAAVPTRGPLLEV